MKLEYFRYRGQNNGIYSYFAYIADCGVDFCWSRNERILGLYQHSGYGNSKVIVADLYGKFYDSQKYSINSYDRILASDIPEDVRVKFEKYVSDPFFLVDFIRQFYKMSSK